MPARWKTGLAVLALSMAGPLAAAPLAPQAVITRCTASAGPMPRGITALNKACPGIEDALTQLRLTALMPPGWRKTLTAAGLADIGTLLQRYSGSPPSEPPGSAVLRSIAAHLVPPPRPPTWSSRIRAWIQHQAGLLLRLIGRRLRSLGSSLGHPRHPQAMIYGLVALLLAAVAALLTLELRGTGFVHRRRRSARPPRRRGIAASVTEPVEAGSREPDWAGLREHPARVLRLLVDTLTRARRLERDRHLTCRELETQARFETEIDRDDFSRVARLAERELYGPPGVTVLSDEALRDARTLHARLLAAGGKGGDIRQ